MRGDGTAEGSEVIASFENRHDAAAAALLRDLHKPPRDPRKVGFDEIEVAERIAMMSVEAGTGDDEVWREVHNPWQDRDLHRLPEDFAGIACTKRGIDDLVVLAAFAERTPNGQFGRT
jgi:hypothetical protein